MQFRHKNIK